MIRPDAAFTPLYATQQNFATKLPEVWPGFAGTSELDAGLFPRSLKDAQGVQKWLLVSSLPA
jgi:hypothetical protein